MDTNLMWIHNLEIGCLKLRDVYKTLNGDSQSDIPFLVRLLENPASPIALPGKIDLRNHDYIHILLSRGTSLQDEAVIVGFTMGNDLDTKWFHILVFKLISWLFYPKDYRFKRADFKYFDLGFAWGRKVTIENINKINLEIFQEMTVTEIRTLFGISIDELTAT